MGDLRRGQATYCPQRQRNRRRLSQRGVTAHKEQEKCVVFLLRTVNGRRIPLRGRLQGRLAFTAATGGFTAQMVGHPSKGDLREPRAWIVGQTCTRPLERRGQRRLLHGVLRSCEVVKAANHGAERQRRQLAQQALDRIVLKLSRHSSSSGVSSLKTGRTSTAVFP